jgi:hypothetical protein
MLAFFLKKGLQRLGRGGTMSAMSRSQMGMEGLSLVKNTERVQAE